jgi:iron complex transport system ATP-binding protein
VTIELRNAAFSYAKGGMVFEGLSFSARSPGVYCLLGPNGCGKTTLLKCLAGLLRLESGEVLLYGRSIASQKRRAIASEVGYIPQEHSRSFAYSVFDMVLMGRAPHLGMLSSPSRKDFAIAAECLDKVGIAGLANSRFTEISGGERQMVQIARVLAQQPRIMLLDEPTSHLDFHNQALILRWISRLAAEGLIVIMSSHVPNHAITYASHVALMHQGRMVAAGKPAEVVTEANLREIYRIDVRIFEIRDPATGEILRFCESVK